MNLKNLAMWGVIVLLSVGLFNMFQNPDKIKSAQNKIAFSTFLTEVENGGFVTAPERLSGCYTKYNSIDDKMEEFNN